MSLCIHCISHYSIGTFICMVNHFAFWPSCRTMSGTAFHHIYMQLLSPSLEMVSPSRPLNGEPKRFKW